MYSCITRGHLESGSDHVEQQSTLKYRVAIRLFFCENFYQFISYVFFMLHCCTRLKNRYNFHTGLTLMHMYSQMASCATYLGV